MEEIFLTIIVIWMLMLSLWWWSTASSRAYVFFYQRNRYKQWKELIKNADKFIKINERSSLSKYKYIGTINNINYQVYFWKYDNGVSIRGDHGSCLTNFDKYYMNKFIEKLPK
jgi:hypothetical protein